MPLFTIIVPVYNVERYVSRCLDSARRQTFTDIEIICIDDGSSDRSPEIIDLHALADSRIRVIHRENGGVSSAKNLGIREAKGEYLLFLDSDDYLDVNACKRLARVFQDTGADVVTFGGRCVPQCSSSPWLDNCFSPRDAVYDGFSSDLIFKENSHPFAWRTAVKRQLLLDRSIFYAEDLALGEDQVFQFALYPEASKTVLIPDKLYCYRGYREDSAMRRLFDENERRIHEHLRIVDKIVADWIAKGIFDLYRADMIEWIVVFLFTDVYRLPGDVCSKVLAKFGENLSARGVDARALAQGAKPFVRDFLLASSAEGSHALSKGALFSYLRSEHGGLRGITRMCVSRVVQRITRPLKAILPMPARRTEWMLNDITEMSRLEEDLQMSLAQLALETRDLVPAEKQGPLRL